MNLNLILKVIILHFTDQEVTIFSKMSQFIHFPNSYISPNCILCDRLTHSVIIKCCSNNKLEVMHKNPYLLLLL